MSKRIAVVLSLCFLVFSGANALALTYNFDGQTLGPVNPLVIDDLGTTITVTPWVDGQPGTVAGIGLGNNILGSPGIIDRLDQYGPQQGGSTILTDWGVQINLSTGVINSFSIIPYFWALQGPNVQLPFEIGYWNGLLGGPAFALIDPDAVRTFTLSDPSDFLLVMLEGNYGQFGHFADWLSSNGWPEVEWQYGFTIASIDYTRTQINAVPEMGTLLLLCSGLAGAAGLRRRFT